MGRLVLDGPEAEALELALGSASQTAGYAARLRRRSERLAARAAELEAQGRALVTSTVALLLAGRQDPHRRAPVRIERASGGALVLAWPDATAATPAASREVPAEA